MIDGTAKTRIATERGKFFSTNHSPNNDPAIATAPEGMLSNAASSLEYPNPAINVAEKVVIAPLGNVHNPAVRTRSQNARSEVMVEITWDTRNRRVATEDLLFIRTR